ncbi:MAG TPA: hypothetical protein VFW11_01770 [Cyclobacteriaceae bacterium]|nr:hypothetical protein [Cyclobacteriaceae bacterium]
MSLQFVLAIIITFALTALIVWGAHWIKINKEQHPEIYKNRRVIAGVIWFLLNSVDF